MRHRANTQHLHMRQYVLQILDAQTEWDQWPPSTAAYLGAAMQAAWACWCLFLLSPGGAADFCLSLVALPISAKSMACAIQVACTCVVHAALQMSCLFQLSPCNHLLISAKSMQPPDYICKVHAAPCPPAAYFFTANVCAHTTYVHVATVCTCALCLF